MKRFAAHLIYLPDAGCLRQMVVEMEAGRVSRLYPLTHEIADTCWLPGLIILPPTADAPLGLASLRQMATAPLGAPSPEAHLARCNRLAPGRPAAYCPHINLTTYQPVGGTPHIQWL